MKVLSRRVATDQTKNVDNGRQDGKGKLQHPKEDRDGRNIEQRREEVGYVKGGDQTPNEVCMRVEQHGPGF